MEEHASAVTLMCSDDATRVPWTAQLEVFDQDFGTAMAIWSVEDAAVGRLCADQPRVTRRQSQLSSSQTDFSLLSGSSQREVRPSRSKKRRRTAARGDESYGRDAPPPPIQCSVELAEETQEWKATQLLSMNANVFDTHGVKTQDITGQDIVVDAVAGDEHLAGSTPHIDSAVDVFTTPTVDRRADNKELKLAKQAFSFPGLEVVRESPLESPLTRGSAITSLRRPADEDAPITSGFSTGSGKSVMVSRKRLREAEAGWSAVEGIAKLDHLAGSNNVQTPSRQDCEGARSGAIPPLTLSTQNITAVIDAKRLSFSAINDEDHDDSTRRIAFQTGSGRRLQLNQESLRKYEALLFSDHPNLNEKSTTRIITEQEYPVSDIAKRTFGSNQLVESARGDSIAMSNQVGDVVAEATGPGEMLTGFQTGAGRTVAVSQERLYQYGNTLFAEHDDRHSPKQVDTSSLDHPHGKPLLAIASGYLGRESSSLPHSTPNISALGFQTASGRTVAIPEERLKEIEDRLFGEDRPSGGADQRDINRESHQLSGKASTGLQRRSAISQKGMREPPIFHCNEDVDSSTIASGFQTGSGSSVHISRERLHEYEQRALSGGEALTNTEGPAVVPVTKSDDASAKAVLSGFTTGSGGRVTVSKERLRVYERMLNDDDSNEMESVLATTGCGDLVCAEEHAAGFVTVPGKFTVSEEKLREYVQIFTEDDAVDASPGLQMHQAASDAVDTNSSFVGGFTTGTGRRVTISEEKVHQYEQKMAMSEETLFRVQSVNDLESQDDRNDVSSISRPSQATDGTAVVLAGFSTGSGRGVSVAEKTLREYQSKISQAFNTENVGSSDKEERVGLPEEKHVVKDFAPVHMRRDSSPQHREGRPPRHRLSTGSLSSTIAAESTNRRHSLPPKSQVKPAGDSATCAVSSGVIQRLAIAHQQNSRPSVLNDVSCNLKPRTRISGLSGGGKWKPPSQVQGSQSSGYSTPAKPQTQGPQNLSAKKGFRPPVPSKTPPSKAFMTTASTQPQKLAHAVETKKTPQIAMHFREAMRISYKLLAPGTDLDTHSFTSLTRANLLLRICPELAPSLLFSKHGDELLHVGDPDDGVSLLGILGEMKERGYIGAETGVTDDWFRNQYRWVVWKLATMELQAPRFLFGRYLTKSQVMYEICKRYERDVVLVQRSILKKILHRDANAGSCMVLRVAAVLPYPVEEEKDVDIVPPPHWKLSVVLTDGWHGIHAIPDAQLAEAFWKHHKAHRLIGKKIVTWSAMLQNVNDGVEPLECALATEKEWANPLWAGKDDPSKWPYLKLHVNSTRPVSVDTRLGLESLVRPALGKQLDAPYDFVMLKSVPMRTLEVGGGIARSVCIRVVRISPILHLQSKDFSIGPRILCEEHMPLYFQARQEYLTSQRNEDTGDDDASSALPLPVPFAKLEVECAHVADSMLKCYAELTVWRPGDEVLSKLKEGGRYYVTSLSVNWKVDYGCQGVFMRVGTTKGSTFERAEAEADHPIGCSRVCETIGELIERYQQHVITMPKEKKLFGDVCVVIVRCEDVNKPIDRPPESNFATSTDHIFVTDTSGRLMSLRLHSMRVYKPSTSTCDQRSENVSSRSKAPECVFTRGNKKLWSEGTVLCVNGLEVSHYDEKLGILDCELVESAQLLSRPAKKSLFFEPSQSLRELLGCCDDSVNGAQELARSIQALKKHVERTILRLDFVPSQDEDDETSDGNEAEILIQELQDQPEDDVNYWMSQAPLMHVEGTVAKILSLHPSDPLPHACDVVAIAYVRSTSRNEAESSFHAIYMTKEILDSTQGFLSGHCDGASTPPLISEAMSDQVLRFGTHWETSERLLNSWKPWERDGGATFLLATAVATGRMTEDS